MKPLNEQINANFIAQAKKLTDFTALLHQIIPIECRNHVKVANFRDHNLMLITDSPVWTTKLRQLSPQILQHIRENSIKISPSNKPLTIHHIQIHTRYISADASQQAINKIKKPVPVISDKTAELLLASANSINNEQLKTALLKIASHKNKN